MINYGKQYIDEKDIKNVVKVLKSNFLTQGPTVEKFEKKLSEYTGSKHCVVVSNGTAALHLAVKSLGLKKGFEAIVPANTFVASANCVLYNKGKVRFADIDRKTYNISISSLEKLINKNTKVIIPVDFAGHPAPMKKIKKIADKYNLKIIRDSCHSIGSEYYKNKTGNCQYSDMTVFSFHPVKHITTGEGGAILTNDSKIYEKLLLLRNHGITKNPQLIQENHGIWYYEMIDLGFNYRITDIQCALGISQLKKLDKFIKKRRKIVEIYNNFFQKYDYIKRPTELKNIKSSYHLYVLLIDFDKLGIDRNSFMMKLKANKINTQVHYIPIYKQPYYKKKYKINLKDFQNSENYYKKCLSLPIYPGLTKKQIYYILKCFKDLLK